MSELTREQVDMLVGASVIEFGAGWCGYCQAARPLIDQVLGEHPEVRHILVEDGRGKRLGRSFGVKLWPTLVFYRDGSEIARVVRPLGVEELRRAMARLAAMPSSDAVATR
jgi:thioredoxin 1